MTQLGIPYQLIGPDGTRAVMGNCDEAMADPDFVGFLDPENGITGLLDGADVREQAGELVEADGGWHGPFSEGRRPGTIQVVLLPNGSVDDVLAAERKLKRATRALQADALLRWTPSDDVVERELRVRRQTAPRVTGRWPKSLQVGLVSADAHVLSSAESTISVTPDQAVGVVGFTSPLSAPFGTTQNATGQMTVVNQGTVETSPRLVIHGPITTPQVLNNTTGKSARFTCDLLATQYIVVNFATASVLLGSDAGGPLSDRYGFVDFLNTEWWTLQPGANDVRILATAYSAGAYFTTYWRHAWE